MAKNLSMLISADDSTELEMRFGPYIMGASGSKGDKGDQGPAGGLDDGDAATLQTASTNAASAQSTLAAIAGGTSADAGTLNGADVLPLSRGGLLQTTLTKIAQFVLSQIPVNGPVSVRCFGALGLSSDDSAAVQAAINACSHVLIPADLTVYLANVTIPSNRVVQVDGTVLMKAGAPDLSVLFKNSDQVSGNANIRLIGRGTLDGNKANQTGGTGTRHHLVDFNLVSSSEFAVANVRGNYLPNAVSGSYDTGCVYISNSTDTTLHDSIGRDYGRECFWMYNCTKSAMYNLKSYGGVDSWSGMQFSGSDNKAWAWYSEAAGASGFSFDCQGSSLNDAETKGNLYFNGCNFGHPNFPTTGSTVSNIRSYDSASNGIQVAAGTSGLTISGFHVERAGAKGVQCSDSSKNVTLANGRILNSASDALYLFGVGTQTMTNFKVNNVTTNAYDGNDGVNTYVSAAAVSGGGSGYAVNDTIPLSGGTGTITAVLTVTSVNAGAITGVSVLTAGAYTVQPANPVAQASTSGSGTGATFALTWASTIDKRNKGYGITVDGCRVDITNCDLSGATTAGFRRLNSGIETARSATRFSPTDVFIGSTAIGSAAAGATVVVTNKNVLASSLVNLLPSNDPAATLATNPSTQTTLIAVPYISTISDGSFTIKLPEATQASGFVRWTIG